MKRFTPSPSIATRSDSEMTGLSTADEWNLVDGAQDLPVRTRVPQAGDALSVKLYPLRSENALLVSVIPPKVPETGLNRAHCDIVLVIDVSGSMASSAPLPDVEDQNAKEAGGLSILDLTKHAARAILQTLKDGDRLAIVTFSDDATVIQDLTAMTADAKKTTWERIEKLHDEGCTNLWSGIKTGLNLFEKADLIGNVQGMYILTDGMPNHMCPPKGYVNSLKPMLAKIANESEGARQPTIHTFGFGYSIRSDLMSSIAEVGKGNYAFIPDAGMIGTVFVHAVANLFTTLGTSASLELKTPHNKSSKKQALSAPPGTPAEISENNSLVLDLGNVQYGQSRDIWMECPGVRKDATIGAVLSYNLPSGECKTFEAQCLYSEEADLSQAQIEYHRYRSEICTFLSSLFPLKENGEHGTIDQKDGLNKAQNRLNALVAQIQGCPDKSGGVESLIDDLAGKEPAGQISKALLATPEQDYWHKWGRHYLPSLLHAHQRQMCNTFKDHGPLLYGKDSPLFIQSRDELDAEFDNLPAPTPSRPPPVITTVDIHGNVTRKKGKHTFVSMSRYNSSSNPCFDGDCTVTMADGSQAPVKTLKPGVSVWTPAGARQVAAVLKTRGRGKDQKLCRVGELLVTPWHPIQHEGEWKFPSQVAENTVASKGAVYSVLLSPSRNSDGHAIEIGGQVCVTLGHGIVKSQVEDVRAHAFFGNYRRVIMSLCRLQLDKNGHFRCVGLQRDARTGLACGFTSPMVSKRIPSMALRTGETMRVRIRA